MKFPKNNLTVTQRRSLKGYLFFLPLLYGLVFFFIIPIVKSLLFSVSDVTSGPEGYQLTVTGFSSYFEALFRHTNYRQRVVEDAIKVLAQTPLIIIYSFFMASVLNGNFKGKTIFRVVMFLPVIFTIMNTKVTTLEQSMDAFSTFKETTGQEIVSFTKQITEFLINAGLSADVAQTITSLADAVYAVIDLSAIQILILLTAMQAVSPSLYEAAKVEGATGWECFWKITFPMVCPMIMTCIIYTIVDSFTSSSGQVMTLIDSTAFSDLQFSLASAMGWIYFSIIALLLAIVAFLFSRLTRHYRA